DRRTLQPRGGPVAIVEGIRRFLANVGSPAASVAISPAGTFAYIPGVSGGAVERAIALVTRDGTRQKLDLPPQAYFFPPVSPDGRQLAVQTDLGSDTVISIYDLGRGGPLRRLTFGGKNRYPVWTPDSRRVTFTSDRDGDRGIFWQLADGTQP